MNKFFVVIFVLIFISCSYLWVKGQELHEIQTEIDIAAPPEKVWAYLSDIDAWQEWSPIINEASGDAEIGSTLTVTMIGREGQNGPTYQPNILSLVEHSYFHWRAVLISGLIMTNDKVFELEETDTGTRLVHKELFSGMLVPIFGNKFEENVPPMLNAMNEALKKTIEK